MKQTESSHYVDNKRLYTELAGWLREVKVADAEGRKRPILPDYVAESMLKIANRLSQKAGFVNYCVDEQTEILTQRGWVNHETFNMDDVVLSIDPSDMTLKWSPVYDIYRAPFEGNMFHLTGNGLDALVTNHHKFLTRERGLVPVEYLRQAEHLVLMGSPLGDDREAVYSNAFVEVVGLAITEGCYKHGKTTSSIRIAQKKKVGIERITSCLIKAGAKFRSYSRKSKINKSGNGDPIFLFHVSGKVANSVIRVAPKKVLSYDFILSLTQEQRLLLIDTMIAADGHSGKRKNTGTPYRTYCQKDKAHFDAFIMLCTMAGIRTRARLQKLNTRFGYVEMWHAYLCESETNTHKVEKIDFHGSRRDLTHGEHFRGESNPRSKLNVDMILEAKLLQSQGQSYKTLAAGYGVCAQSLHNAVTGKTWKHLKVDPIPNAHEASTPYMGIIWCPTTKYGTIITRRNGRVYAQGQSYRDEMCADAMESVLRYIHNFDPDKYTNAFAYITQIVHNAFIRRIQKEQKQLYVKMKIVDQADFINSYERQRHDSSSYNNSYVTYLQENMGEVIAKFEGWKEGKKRRSQQRKNVASVSILFEEDQDAKEDIEVPIPDVLDEELITEDE